MSALQGAGAEAGISKTPFTCKTLSSVWVLLFLLFNAKIEESFDGKPLPGTLQSLADHKQGCRNQLLWESQDF